MTHDAPRWDFRKILTRLLLPAILGGALVLAFQRMYDDDDRPPIIVSNGSVIIEDAGGMSSAGPGEFRKSTSNPAGRTVYVHEHDGKGPRKFNASVSASTCGASYYGLNLKRAVFTYTAAGASREIEVRRRSTMFSRALEFDVDNNASQGQPVPERLVIDEADGRLVSVRLEFNGPTQTRTCEFSDAETARVVFHQTQ